LAKIFLKSQHLPQVETNSGKMRFPLALLLLPVTAAFADERTAIMTGQVRKG
jgi:hypothetical protein